MSYPDRSTHSPTRRIWRYVSTLLAVSGLVALALATFLPPEPAAGSGSLPSRLNVPLPDGVGIPVRQGSPIFQKPGPPTETHLVKADSFTGDLRKLPYVKPEKQERPEREGPELQPMALPDSSAPAASPAAPIGPLAPAPAPIMSFDGLDFATWGAGHPPDTNGDVGPAYYIQSINTSIGIYNKATGALVTAFTFDTFMSQGNFGNLCDTDNFGDPVVLYDTFEDRWIITDFAFQLDGSSNVINPPGAFECFAVSRSGDPVTGGWNFYSINTAGGLGDYPKLGIWPDGLYMSVNMFDYAASGSFQDVRVYALNKAQMYAGESNVQVVTFDVTDTGEFTLLPSNARLQTGTPPTGTPNYFVSTWQYLNALVVYKFHVDWNSLTTSTFTGPELQQASSSWPSANVPNAATPGNSLDVLQIRAMMQNQYTNIGGVESLWTSHTVRRANTTGFAAPRWYQLNVTGGTVAANMVQAATWDPDGANVTYRYMPSVAVDRMGDMALGYSASNETTNPSIRYAGRLYTDTLNTLPQTEITLTQGTGTQTGNCGGTICTRWGDYSAMTLDPDGCTFWYTNQYYAVSGLNHLTRIGSFRFPSCTTVGTGAITGTVIDAGNSSPLSGVTVTLGSRITTTNGSGVYQFRNLPAGVYPNITASYPGYNSSSAGPITVTTGLTTTQNFALSTASPLGCYVDTTQANFQTGVPTNCDLTSSPGNVILLSTATLDQQNTSVTTSGFGFNSTSWVGQTFQPAVTGQLTRADVYLFCSGCTGTTPNLTVSIRATSSDLPTGSDLATATIPGFSSGTGGYYSANFAAPATLTAGTRYAIVVRPVSNPSAGTYAYVVSTGSPYANGRRATSANSGGSWTERTDDLGFRTYMHAGYASTGNFVSSLKDANPSGAFTPRWTTLSWTATTPANTSVKFQAAASNSAIGPFTFVGPDGTASTYFTTTGASLNQFDGLRYLKYKAYLTTTNSITTPTLADVTICFSNTIKITPTISLVSSQNPSLVGQAVTFTATVSSGAGTPTGQLQFKDNGVNLGAVQNLSSGSATLITSTLTIGSHTITANYLGNAFFNANIGALVPDQIVTSTVTWIGNTNTNWFIAANWTPAAVPTTAVNVIIPTAPGGNRWPILTGTATINNLTLQSGAVLTISQGIALNVNGLVTNDGALTQIKNVPASVTTEFLRITDASGTVDKYHGVDLTPVTAMGVTTVQIKGNQAACTTVSTDPIVHRCFRIDPTTSAIATVRFWYTEAERNNQTASALNLWHWGPWTQVGTPANYTYSESAPTCTSGGGQACWFQSTGVASYSPFALGSGSSPTALHLTRVASDSAATSPIVPLVVLLLGLSMSLILFKRRHV